MADRDDLSNPDLYSQSDIKLSARELHIAHIAARIAVREITDDFYKNVGKSLVQKFLIVIGALVVGFLAGKGWIKWS